MIYPCDASQALSRFLPDLCQVSHAVSHIHCFSLTLILTRTHCFSSFSHLFSDTPVLCHTGSLSHKDTASLTPCFSHKHKHSDSHLSNTVPLSLSVSSLSQCFSNTHTHCFPHTLRLFHTHYFVRTLVSSHTCSFSHCFSLTLLLSLTASHLSHAASLSRCFSHTLLPSRCFSLTLLLSHPASLTHFFSLFSHYHAVRSLFSFCTVQACVKLHFSLVGCTCPVVAPMLLLSY